VGPQLPPQLPITAPICSKCTYIFKMSREKGKEWNHVRVIELKDVSHQRKVECKYCKHVFVAGVSRIREHFLRIYPTYGVAKYTADEAVLQPVLDEMGAIDAQNKAVAAAAEQRQLDRSTAANASTSSAPARKQRTLAVCRGADLAERTQVLEQGGRSGTSIKNLQR